MHGLVKRPIKVITTQSNQGASNEGIFNTEVMYDGLGRTTDTRSYSVLIDFGFRLPQADTTSILSTILSATQERQIERGTLHDQVH